MLIYQSKVPQNQKVPSPALTGVQATALKAIASLFPTLKAPAEKKSG